MYRPLTGFFSPKNTENWQTWHGFCIYMGVDGKNGNPKTPQGPGFQERPYHPVGAPTGLAFPGRRRVPQEPGPEINARRTGAVP
jgi:hypothetical protein